MGCSRQDAAAAARCDRMEWLQPTVPWLCSGAHVPIYLSIGYVSMVVVRTQKAEQTFHALSDGLFAATSAKSLHSSAQ